MFGALQIKSGGIYGGSEAVVQLSNTIPPWRDGLHSPQSSSSSILQAGRALNRNLTRSVRSTMAAAPQSSPHAPREASVRYPTTFSEAGFLVEAGSVLCELRWCGGTRPACRCRRRPAACARARTPGGTPGSPAGGTPAATLPPLHHLPHLRKLWMVFPALCRRVSL